MYAQLYYIHFNKRQVSTCYIYSNNTSCHHLQVNFNIALSLTRGHNSVKIFDRETPPWKCIMCMIVNKYVKYQSNALMVFENIWLYKNWYENFNANFNIALSPTRGHNSVKMFDRVTQPGKCIICMIVNKHAKYQSNALMVFENIWFKKTGTKTLTQTFTLH